MTTRRSFLKAIAAAVMAPTIQLRNTVPAEQILLSFCRENDDFRWNIDKPFASGSLTYATDAKAMIRCELANRLEDGERRLPPVEPVWRDLWLPDQWIPLSELDQSPKDSVNSGLCPECGGRRIQLKEYPNINDPGFSGYVGPDWDPDENTIGDRSCKTCRGEEFSGPSISRICGIQHNTYSLKRIAAIPDVKVCRSRSEKWKEALLFKADGFEGISLGMGYEYDVVAEFEQIP